MSFACSPVKLLFDGSRKFAPSILETIILSEAHFSFGFADGGLADVSCIADVVKKTPICKKKKESNIKKLIGSQSTSTVGDDVWTDKVLLMSKKNNAALSC